MSDQPTRTEQTETSTSRTVEEPADTSPQEGAENTDQGAMQQEGEDAQDREVSADDSASSTDGR